jgi:hypothetical protein
VVNYSKTNAVDLNFLSASLHYRNNFFRTSMGLMTGSYAKNNLAAEDKWARNIYEANVGFHFTNDEEIWLDAGILPSHIGFESVPASKNWSGTRSLVADLSPYYETGLRLSYRPNKSWYLAILALNGWQRITTTLNDFGKSWGMHISFNPKPNWQINSGSFIGQIPVGNKVTTRIYSNLYSTLQLNPRMWVMAGWDWGIQENNTKQWNDILINYKYALIYEKLLANIRYEYLSDPTSLLLPGNKDLKHKVNMTSINIDVRPVKNFTLRSEVNYSFSRYAIFPLKEQLTTSQWSFFLIASVNLEFIK